MSQISQPFKCQKETSYVLIAWLLLVFGTVVFYSCINKDFTYFKYGPNSSLSFLGIKITTWPEWGVLLSFSTLTQAFKVFSDEVISPWIINTVMDHKAGKIENFSYFEIQLICQTYYAFSATVKFIQIAITFSQIDMVLAFIATDIIVSFYTTRQFLIKKEKINNSIIPENMKLYV